MRKLDWIFSLLILIAVLHIVRHMVSTPGGPFYLAGGGADKAGTRVALASETRFALPKRGIFSRASAGATETSVTAGYARIALDSGSEASSGFAVFSLRRHGVLVGEAAVPASPPIRDGRVYVEINGPLTTGLAIANPNDQPVTLSFYFTDSNGRDFNSGMMSIPANGQVVRFLNQPPFNAGSSVMGTLTFNSNLEIGAVALRRYTNERSEFLITTLPVIELKPRPESTLVFPHFADGSGWSTEVLLVNPAETALTGIVSFTIPAQPAANFNYSIPPKSAQRIRRTTTRKTIRTGSVRVTPAAGSQAPDGILILTFKRGGVTVSEAGVGAVRAGSDFRIYAESSESVQTGIALANLSAAPITVNLELTAESGEALGSAPVAIEGAGQVALFLNQINGLSVPTSLKGLLRLSTSSPQGIVVTGLRSRKNERGDFLISSMPAIREPTSTASFLLPYIVDGGGYSTQFVLFSKTPASAPSGTLRFYNQSGQPLALSVR